MNCFMAAVIIYLILLTAGAALLVTQGKAILVLCGPSWDGGTGYSNAGLRLRGEYWDYCCPPAGPLGESTQPLGHHSLSWGGKSS